LYSSDIPSKNPEIPVPHTSKQVSEGRLYCLLFVFVFFKSGNRAFTKEREHENEKKWLVFLFCWDLTVNFSARKRKDVTEALHDSAHR